MQRDMLCKVITANSTNSSSYSIINDIIYNFLANSYFLHAKKDDGMANNFSSRRSFELIFLPTGSYSSG